MSSQGSFPNIVVGSVYVTDADDYDIDDKTFEIDPSTSNTVETRFSVDKNSGNITMRAGTAPGLYVLIVKVSFENKAGLYARRQLTFLFLTSGYLSHPCGTLAYPT